VFVLARYEIAPLILGLAAHGALIDRPYPPCNDNKSRCVIGFSFDLVLVSTCSVIASVSDGGHGSASAASVLTAS
jgi:hypothetical protein